MLFPTLLATIGLASSTYAWGSLGHKTVASVALSRLPYEASRAVSKILFEDDHKTSPNPTLFDIANWADDFARSPDGAFSKEFHYINANDNPPLVCNVDLDRDCSGAGGCIVKAIVNYTEQLVARRGSPSEMADAIKFLVHLFGDITTPLHAEGLARGGNDIPVIWREQKKSLHSVWDTDIITKLAGPDEEDNMYKWTNTIVGGVEDEYYNVTEWLKCTDINDALKCATEWAAESNALVCSYVLKDNPQGKELSGKYYRGAAPIVEEQVGKAGFRLLVWLDQIFGSGHPGLLPSKGDALLVQDEDF